MYKKSKSCSKSAGKSSAKKSSRRTKENTICGALKNLLLSPDPMENYQPSEGLFEEEDVEGRELFKVTPLKPKRILKDVASASKTTPSKKLATLPQETPLAEREQQRKSLRQRMKKDLAVSNSYLQSDPEDSDESLSSEEESDEDDSSPRKKSRQSSKSFSETYFHAQKKKMSDTSNRTLSSLKLQRTDIGQLQEVLQRSAEHHCKDEAAMMQRLKASFSKWHFLMSEGFNILLYGVGSKRHLLNAFCKELLEKELFITFNGFFPSLNIKQMLSVIIEEGLQLDEKFSNLQEHTEFIKKHLAEVDQTLYLVIHNIDGVALKNVKTQTALSSLADSPNIRLICSVDHINSPLIWTQVQLSGFRWVWCEASTFQPYIIETSYEDTLLRDQCSQLLLSSLLHVYRSLPPNGQGVFKILATHQQQDSSTGLTFPEWYEECREAFLVNSEVTMKAQLSEFKNHKLLAAKKSAEGNELWYIPVDSATLEQFLDSCK